MNHKWKYFEKSKKSIRREIDRRRCVQCLMEVRRIRRGSDEPHRGRIQTQFRVGKVGPWKVLTDPQLPPCNACRECPTCNGTGLVTLKEYKEEEE